ncbi:MAG: 4-hydroxy-tetrahydrodipicolinate synthase [Bacteroidales bacterium]
MKKFIGTGVAIVTPFNNDYSIDYNSLKVLINNLIENNVDFLVLLGSTGETSCISLEEQNSLIEYTIEVVNKRIPIVVGCTFNNTTEGVKRAKQLSNFDIDAILSASPFYNKPSQDGIYNHFKLISQNSKHPIILYNVPGRTCSNILPHTAVKLYNDCENIVAIKEASGNINQVMDLINIKDDNFIVLSGEDALNVPLISVGVQGTISVVANTYPKLVSNMIKKALEGDFYDASKIHYNLLKVTNLLFAEGNPAGVKALLSVQNKCNNILRLPLLSVSSNLIEKLKEEDNILKIIEIEYL